MMVTLGPRLPGCLLVTLAALVPRPAHAEDAARTNSLRVRPAAVFAYAWVASDPIPLAGGGKALVADFDNPPRSYVQLDGFEASEESRFPRAFDAVVVLANDTKQAPGRVEVSISVLARVGPFVEDPDTGMTDYKRGLAEAAWQKEPLLSGRKVLQLDTPRRYATATIDSLPLRGALDRLAASRRWPFEIEVIAELSCARCEKGARVTRRMSVTPGD